MSSLAFDYYQRDLSSDSENVFLIIKSMLGGHGMKSHTIDLSYRIQR